MDFERRQQNLAYGIELYNTLNGTANKDLVIAHMNLLGSIGDITTADTSSYDNKVLQYLFDTIDSESLNNPTIYDKVVGILTEWLVESIDTPTAKGRISNILYECYMFPC